MVRGVTEDEMGYASRYRDNKLKAFNNLIALNKAMQEDFYEFFCF